MSIKKEHFGTLPTGGEVYSYTLSNNSNVSVRILDYGCIITNIWVSRDGNTADVVCGYDTIDGYLIGGGYQGALIGRVANRIKDGRFILDGIEYSLAQNDSPRTNSLHGGNCGFNGKLWSADIISDSDEPEIELHRISPDGEENYPGNLSVKCVYKLTGSALSVRYIATTDKTTVVNITNHSYFNLAGYDSGSVCGQILYLDSDKYLENDENLIPTGNFVDVTGTMYDFRTPKAISGDILQNGGIDNSYILNGIDGDTVRTIANITDPVSGKSMTVSTNQPCIGIYTANMIDEDDVPFKGGVPQRKNCAVCFETQKMPDAINHPGFDNTILYPGETYDYTTIYEFN